MNDASSQEGDSGELDAVFTVSISEPHIDPVVIDAMSADGTAHEPGDYGVMTTRLTFAPGQSSKTIVVKVHGDTVDEPDENFFVNLTVVSGDVVLGDGQGEGTIVDDDPLVGLAVGDTNVTEGNSGTTAATLAVTLSSASGQTVTVDFHTADGTAHAPSDYTGASGTLTFSPGQTTKNVAVSVNGDTEIEPNETFLVELTNPTNATIEHGTGTGTILNDDAAGPPPPPPPPPGPPPPPPPPPATSTGSATAPATSTTASSARTADAPDDPGLPVHDHGDGQARRPAGDEPARRALRPGRKRHPSRRRRERRAHRRQRQ